MPKIVSECCELMKLCRINCSGPTHCNTSIEDWLERDNWRIWVAETLFIHSVLQNDLRFDLRFADYYKEYYNTDHRESLVLLSVVMHHWSTTWHSCHHCDYRWTRTHHAWNTATPRSAKPTKTQTTFLQNQLILVNNTSTVSCRNSRTSRSAAFVLEKHLWMFVG